MTRGLHGKINKGQTPPDVAKAQSCRKGENS